MQVPLSEPAPGEFTGVSQLTAVDRGNFISTNNERNIKLLKYT